MQNIDIRTLKVCATSCVLIFVAGCETSHPGSAQSSAAPTPAPMASPATDSGKSVPSTTGAVVRIKAGVSAPFKDSSGNVWAAEQGFDGGSVIERDAGTVIANTKDPGLYLSEHYGMTAFSCPVPNGKYVVHLHFAETFDGITAPGQRVFSFNVQGHNFKDFDVFVKAGGPNRAYIETVPVEVTDGKFTSTFTSNVENPEINAIELVPQP
jgi:hypothetical protein